METPSWRANCSRRYGRWKDFSFDLKRVSKSMCFISPHPKYADGSVRVASPHPPPVSTHGWWGGPQDGSVRVASPHPPVSTHGWWGGPQCSTPAPPLTVSPRFCFLDARFSPLSLRCCCLLLRLSADADSPGGDGGGNALDSGNAPALDGGDDSLDSNAAYIYK